jgi:uncharacterized membrane-anchored protein
MIEMMPHKGSYILKLDANGVGSFARLDDGSPLTGDEHRLRYKTVHWTGDLAIGAESFFFQEGQAEVYEDARYGVLRVDEKGRSVLVGLADENFELIAAAR